MYYIILVVALAITYVFLVTALNPHWRKVNRNTKFLDTLRDLDADFEFDEESKEIKEIKK